MLGRSLHKAASLARAFYDDFQEFMSPSACLSCGRERDFPDTLLCPTCYDNLTRKNTGGGPICPFCARPAGTKSSCARCVQSPLDLYFWGYYDDELKECLQQFKFHNAVELGKRLSRMAAAAMGETLARNCYDIVVPVPLHKGRERERLFNQSEVIALEIARSLNTGISPGLLTRIKPTRQQAKLDEASRWNNVRDAFVIAGDSVEVSGKSILLVDDIVTTGATVYEASRALLAAGPKRLDIFSLAYAK